MAIEWRQWNFIFCFSFSEMRAFAMSYWKWCRWYFASRKKERAKCKQFRWLVDIKPTKKNEEKKQTSIDTFPSNRPKEMNHLWFVEIKTTENHKNRRTYRFPWTTKWCSSVGARDDGVFIRSLNFSLLNVCKMRNHRYAWAKTTSTDWETRKYCASTKCCTSAQRQQSSRSFPIIDHVRIDGCAVPLASTDFIETVSCNDKYCSIRNERKKMEWKIKNKNKNKTRKKSTFRCI